MKKTHAKEIKDKDTTVRKKEKGNLQRTENTNDIITAMISHTNIRS